MDARELVDPLLRLLDHCAPPAMVRAIDAGGDAAPVWQAIAEAGYGDALLAEAAGGAGLDLATLAPVIEALGARALPLPVADTIVARALIGGDAPPGPIVLVSALAQPVAGARLAEHALVDTGAALVLCPIAALDPQPTGVHGSSALQLRGNAQGPQFARPAGGLRPIAAVLRALLIAGAAGAMTAMTTDHANTRVQFGKPIGRQQAVQHLLAVMAQDLVAVRIAARLGAGRGLDVPVALAASAKITAGAAAVRLAASAHAVHGAIGIAAEHDLNLFTRRLHEWRLADGSEAYWAGLLGHARLAAGQSSVDWMREAIFG